MFNKMFLQEECAALAYQAIQLEKAGYPDKAKMIRRKRIDLSPVIDAVSSAVASLFAGSRDLPAALAYDAAQIADAGYLPETNNDEKPSGLFENVTAWIMTRPAPRTAAPCLATTTIP